MPGQLQAGTFIEGKRVFFFFFMATGLAMQILIQN